MKKSPVKNLIAENIGSVVEVETIDRSKNRLRQPMKYHYHNALQIVVFQKGETEFMVDSMLKKVGAGSVLIFGSDLPHGVIGFSEDVKVTILHIPYSVLSWCAEIPELKECVEFIKSSRHGYVFNSYPLIKQSMPLIRKLVKSEGFEKLSVLFSLLNLFEKCDNFERLVLNVEDKSRSLPDNNQSAVERALIYLYKNFDKEISLKEIAAYAGQNSAALCRSFKRSTSQTIFQFINRLRIEKACHLLNTTDLTVAQIAYRSGYETFSHFSTQFRSILKMSPNAYREKNIH